MSLLRLSAAPTKIVYEKRLEWRCTYLVPYQFCAFKRNYVKVAGNAVIETESYLPKLI